MSATIIRETHKPQCRSRVDGLMEVLRIRADRCLRKRNHRGRCVGTWLVWDHRGVIQLQRRLQGKAN